MNTLNNPHDKFIKSILSDKSLAIDYLSAFLPKELSDIILYDTLKIEDNSYIDDYLIASFSDLVYSMKIKSFDEPIEIAILFEHKSYVDKNVQFQILYYIASIWIKAINKNETPKLVIPILFYHGKEQWDYKNINEYFGKIPSHIQKYIPNYEYIFNNLKQISDDQLWALNNQFLASTFLTMKHYFNPHWIENHIVELFTRFLENNINLNQQFIVYTLNFVNINKEKEIEIIDKLPNNQKKEIMNTLERLKQEGRNEGIQIGIEKGIKLMLF
ncbi:MAG: Rpn family recombination-promoting nuclease/putative transposase [Saprospiraceae bacterium]|nr:Rpn family recombination-promoting nuclease/putative transposase [Saprospiraceae bacterium]